MPRHQKVEPISCNGSKAGYTLLFARSTPIARCTAAVCASYRVTMALLLNSALPPCLIPTLSQGCLNALSRWRGWSRPQTGPAQALAASATVRIQRTASTASVKPAADANLPMGKLAAQTGSNAVTSKAKQPHVRMTLLPQFTVGCQLSRNSASRLEAFHTASTLQWLPVPYDLVWGLVVSAGTAFREQSEDDNWEDNPRYLGNYKELSGITYRSMRLALKKRPHLLESMGITPAEFESYDLDHIIPESKSGPDGATNLVVMPRSKNRNFGAEVNAEKVREVGLKTWVKAAFHYAHHHSLDHIQIKLAEQSLVPWQKPFGLVSTAAAPAAAAAGIGSSAWNQSVSLIGLYELYM